MIDAAATKPFGFQAFFPGPGWGGHCIPVDPAYLSWRVRQMGETARFVELAREINKKMPVYVVQRIGEALNEHGKSMKAAKVMLLGVTYKADVGDIRESPAEQIIKRLIRSGADVSFHDPFVETIEVDGAVLERTSLTQDALKSSDIVVIVTDHSDYDWGWVLSNSQLVLDTRNAMRGLSGPIVKL